MLTGRKGLYFKTRAVKQNVLVVQKGTVKTNNKLKVNDIFCSMKLSTANTELEVVTLHISTLFTVELNSYYIINPVI